MLGVGFLKCFSSQRHLCTHDESANLKSGLLRLGSQGYYSGQRLRHVTPQPAWRHDCLGWDCLAVSLALGTAVHLLTQPKGVSVGGGPIMSFSRNLGASVQLLGWPGGCFHWGWLLSFFLKPRVGVCVSFRARGVSTRSGCAGLFLRSTSLHGQPRGVFAKGGPQDCFSDPKCRHRAVG